MALPPKCPQCNSVFPAKPALAVCPQCGASLGTAPDYAPSRPEKDHRGVTLPARHLTGGIITPQ